MFSNLLSSLQLGSSSDENAEQIQRCAKETSAAEGSRASTNGQHVSFWGVAAAVSATVRATADDFVKTVKQTDWQSELSNFGKEVAQDTKSLGTNAVTLVDHFPLHMDNADQAYQGDENFANPLEHAEVAAKFEQMGSALANFGRSLVVGTQELVEQVRDAVETEIVSVVKEQKAGARSRGAASGSRLPAGAGKYNRFEAEVTAMQRDSSTYCDEPEDKEDFAVWKASFKLSSKRSEIDKIVKQNAFMAELQSRIVPLIVEREDFWTRYFYRLHKLQVKEAQRQDLHSRMAKEEDTEVSWDDDDSISSTRTGSPPTHVALPPTFSQNTTAPQARAARTTSHAFNPFTASVATDSTSTPSTAKNAQPTSGHARGVLIATPLTHALPGGAAPVNTTAHIAAAAITTNPPTTTTTPATTTIPAASAGATAPANFTANTPASTYALTHPTHTPSTPTSSSTPTAPLPVPVSSPNTSTNAHVPSPISGATTPTRRPPTPVPGTPQPPPTTSYSSPLPSLPSPHSPHPTCRTASAPTNQTTAPRTPPPSTNQTAPDPTPHGSAKDVTQEHLTPNDVAQEPLSPGVAMIVGSGPPNPATVSGSPLDSRAAVGPVAGATVASLRQALDAGAAAHNATGLPLRSSALERQSSTPETGSDVTSPEWCVISNASASDAGVMSLNADAYTNAPTTAPSSEPHDEEEELEGVAEEGGAAHGGGVDDDEEVDEDWGNWG